MSMNDPTLSGVVRNPRAIVKVGTWGNLIRCNAWLDLEVTNNVVSSADTFHVTLATSALPNGFDDNWFSQQTDLYVNIFMGLPDDPDNYSESDLVEYILGQVDTINYDPLAATITLTGRDLTRVFIDTKSSQKYPQLTSSQIAAKLCAAHGLTPNITATKVKVGKYYQIDHVTMTDEKSDWDLLLYLANLENYCVYVRGSTLYFNPKPTSKTDPYVIQWSVPDETGNNYAVANVQSLHLSRALTVSRGITVTIRSWNEKQSKVFTAAWPTNAKNTSIGKAGPFGGSQNYVRTIPGLTMDQALQKAESLYDQIVAHEMKLEAELPGDDLLDTNVPLQLTGTNTYYDQIYYPDSISRRMDWDGGYMMTVSAKNVSPVNEVNL